MNYTLFVQTETEINNELMDVIIHIRKSGRKNIKIIGIPERLSSHSDIIDALGRKGIDSLPALYSKKQIIFGVKDIVNFYKIPPQKKQKVSFTNESDDALGEEMTADMISKKLRDSQRSREMISKRYEKNMQDSEVSSPRKDNVREETHNTSNNSSRSDTHSNNTIHNIGGSPVEDGDDLILSKFFEAQGTTDSVEEDQSFMED